MTALVGSLSGEVLTLVTVDSWVETFSSLTLLVAMLRWAAMVAEVLLVIVEPKLPLFRKRVSEPLEPGEAAKPIEALVLEPLTLKLDISIPVPSIFQRLIPLAVADHWRPAALSAPLLAVIWASTALRSVDALPLPETESPTPSRLKETVRPLGEAEAAKFCDACVA